MKPKSAQKGFVQARQHFDAGRMQDAEAACRAILARDPAAAPALSLLAAILSRRGEYAAAILLLQDALRQKPADPAALCALGDAYAACNQHAAAVDAFRRACAADHTDPMALAKLGSSLATCGELDQAESAIRSALVLCPHSVDLQTALGTILTEQGRFDEAVLLFRQTLTRAPRVPHLQAALGKVLMKQGRFDEAIAAYSEAITLAPNRTNDWLGEANRQMALVLRARGQLGAAAAALEQALALCPAWTNAHNDLGLIYKDLGRVDDAIGCYRRAIALDPRHAAARSNLGAALSERGQFEAAAAMLEAAVALAPAEATVNCNYAIVLKGLGRLDEARIHFDKAVAGGTPDAKHAIACFNRAQLLLLNGELPLGLAEYEWRRKGGNPVYMVRTFEQPEWAGEDLAGRTILLYAEQGIGDSIQFCRYAAMVEALGARVILEVQAPLVALLAASFPGATVVAYGDRLPPFDCHFPLMSLPWRFATTLDTIPAAVPYLAADPAKRAAWREQLKGAGGLKVGLVWAGNPNTTFDRQRSLSLQALLPHLPREGVSLFSLQKELRSGEDALLAEQGDLITNLSPLLNDFSDTAAAVSALDLVISIDSAVTHLAGALARPAWVLMPYALDWRWFRDRTDSPWYPSLRLFRQSVPHQWADALAQLGEALRAAARGGVVPPPHGSRG